MRRLSRRLLFAGAVLVANIAAPAAGAAINVGITSPQPGAHSLAGVVPVLVNASADQGIYSVQLEVDGVPYGIPDTTPVGPYQYEIDWDTSGESVGNHTLAVLVTDWSQLGGGVQQASDPVTVDVGPTYPTISLTVPQAYTFQRATVALTSTVGGGQAPTNVVYSVDGNPLSSSSWDTTTSGDGVHTVSATVTDGRGKTASASAQVTVDNTAPTTYLISPSVGSYFQDSLPVSAHADGAYGIASVQYEIDGKPAGSPVTTPDASGGGYTYSASLDISSLSKGAHTLADVATDSAGNTAASAPVSFTVGVVPPQVSLALPPDWTFAHGTVQVTASPSGGTPPYSVQLYVDGAPSGAPQTSAPYSFTWDTTKVSDGAHTLSVSLTDGDGKTASSGLDHQTVDNTPPSTYLISPGPGGYFAGTLAVSAHADDAYGISSVQFEIDGSPASGPILAPDTASGYTYSASLDISKLTPGVHTLTDVATDAAGSTTGSTSVSFTVASAGAPQLTLTTPSDWTFAHGSVPVTAVPSGGNGPYSVQLEVDGTPSGAPDTSAPYAFIWDSTKVSDGTHTLSAVATDNDGHSVTSEAVHQTVDNTAPSTYLISPTAGGYFTGALAASAHASDVSGVAAVLYKIDGAPVGGPILAPDTAGGYTYSASLDISKLTPGHHTLTEVATDAAGNSTTSAPVQFTVSSSALTVLLTTPSDWTFAHGSVPITAVPSGGNGPYSVQLQIDGAPSGTPVATAPYSFNWDTTKVSDGTHTLAAVVTDDDGDTATASAVHQTVDNTPPSTYLITPTTGGYFTGTLAASAHADGAYGIESVQYLIDGTPAGGPILAPDTAGGYTYSASLDITKLAAGHHTLTEVATDAAGNSSTSAPVQFTIAGGPPQVTLSSPPDWTFTHGTETVTAAPTSGVGPYSLQLEIDGAPSGPPVSASGQYSFNVDTTTLTDGTHAIAVGLTDGDGDTASSQTAHVTVDNTPPSTYLITPAAGGYFTGTLAVSAHASDSSGISGVQYQIDGKPAGAALTSPDTAGGYTYSASLDISKLTPGQHTLTEVATDAAGNTTTSASVSFTLASGPPLVTLTLPPDWTLAHGTVPITAAVSGGVGPFSVQLYVDGTASGAPVTSAPFTLNWDTTKMSDGTHTLSVVLTDADKQTASSAVVHQTVDNTPPSTYLISPAAGGWFTGTLAVSAHASDVYGIGSVQYLVDGKTAGTTLIAPDKQGGYTYSETLDISKLTPGQHTLTEVATDAAGNTATSAPVSVGVGVGPGTVKIAAPANVSYAHKTVTVTATVTGGTAPFTGTLAVDGATTTLVPTVAGSTLTFSLDTTKLTDGSHTLAVTITDAATLSATSPVVNVTVDNTAPTAVMYQPTPLAGFSYARTNGPTTFQVHASDAYGVKSVQFTVDGSAVGVLLTKPDTTGGYLYTMALDTSTLKAGMHSIAALVTDNAGNTTTAPSLSVKSGPIVYVPVLNYHGIEGPLDEEPDIYDQTSAQADAELSYLKTSGYQSITLPQYETWLQTGALPVGITKPVLITVDDGLTDELAWDPLLQKYGFKAVLYVVTGFADNTTPGANDPTGNMSWSQIQSFAANGRWTIAFHAGEYGHGDYSEAGTTIKLSSTQTQTYATSCWTYYNCLGTIATTTTTGIGPTKKTTTTTAPETPAQFESQLSSEITTGMAELKQKVPSADLSSWACPWNACGQWTNFYNDPSGTIQSWFPSFAASKFQVVFMQTDPITYGLASGTVDSLNGDNRHYRFEVHTDTTIQQFATALTDPAFANN